MLISHFPRFTRSRINGSIILLKSTNGVRASATLFNHIVQWKNRLPLKISKGVFIQCISIPPPLTFLFWISFFILLKIRVIFLKVGDEANGDVVVTVASPSSPAVRLLQQKIAMWLGMHKNTYAARSASFKQQQHKRQAKRVSNACIIIVTFQLIQIDIAATVL